MKRVCVAVVLCTLIFFLAGAGAISLESQVATAGEPVPAGTDFLYNWPRGVLELVNDEARLNGWQSIFSELPNDICRYEMNVESTEDIQRLIVKLLKIDTDEVCIELSPDDGFFPPKASSETVKTKICVEFSVGSQKLVNAWYERLPEVEPGVREFGVNRYHKVPEAQAPTLTLFVGSPVVDLYELKIPERVKVVVAYSDLYKETYPRKVEVIDRYIAYHKENPASEETVLREFEENQKQEVEEEVGDVEVGENAEADEGDAEAVEIQEVENPASATDDVVETVEEN